MQKIKAIARKPYLLVLFCVCILLFLSSFKLGGFNTSAFKKQVDFPVVSLVPNLATVEVKLQKDHVLLTLRNDSNKTITAFVWSSSEVIYNTEMIGSDSTM